MVRSSVKFKRNEHESESLKGRKILFYFLNNYSLKNSNTMLAKNTIKK